MDCKHHPATAAVDRCAGCAESFCGDCLVEIHGQRYCASCKTMTVTAVPVLEDGNLPCETASKALSYAIIGLFCFGFVLGPMAIAKAVEARRQINADPRLCGIAKANIALLLGAAVFIFWIVGMIAKAKARM